MDSNKKSDEHLGKASSNNSRHIMWNFSEEDKRETHGLFPVPGEHSLSKEEASSQTVAEKKSSSDAALSELKELTSKERAITHWHRFFNEIKKRQHGLRKREAAAEEQPSLVSDLKLESFSLPPQQLCVVREEAPKFAQGLLINKHSDSELEVPKNSLMLDKGTNPSEHQSMESGLISVNMSAPTSSSFTEASRRKTSQIKRRSTKSQVSTSTDEVSTTASKSKKSTSISRGSTGPHFPNFRQRQQELHRYRVLIEQRRLDLLELRIAREREEAKQYMILFQKKMQIKECMIRAHEANNCSNA
ncbi:uncharacterized protein [Drosophila kikkawai]|uniref:Uncharacterized protein n=1 Tax=Drosophila kikkawai TaxID=30033 RepID=A0A6P4J7R2_DROKI|nr:uncharacterized protein LOC108085466 [Drosophila kikkawai]